MTAVRALTCAEVADEVQMSTDTIRRLVAKGAFPGPVDPALGKKLWRWSSLAVDAYKAGQWKRGAA